MMKKIKLWAFKLLKGSFHIAITPANHNDKSDEIDIEVFVFDECVYSKHIDIKNITYIKLDI